MTQKQIMARIIDFANKVGASEDTLTSQQNDFEKWGYVFGIADTLLIEIFKKRAPLVEFKDLGAKIELKWFLEKELDLKIVIGKNLGDDWKEKVCVIIRDGVKWQELRDTIMETIFITEQK